MNQQERVITGENIPPDISEQFEEVVRHGNKKEIKDGKNLFTTQNNRENSVSRTYWRYEGDMQTRNGRWIEDESWENYLKRNKKIFANPTRFQHDKVSLPCRFAISNSLELHQNGTFHLTKGSFASEKNPIITPKETFELIKDVELSANQEIRDLYFGISYGLSGELERIFLNQIWFYNEIDQASKYANDMGYMIIDVDKNNVRTSTNKTVIGISRNLPYGTRILGREIKIEKDNENMSLEVERLKKQGSMDFKLTIPLQQPMVEIIDFDGADKTLFAWERDLIPDPLLTDPMQKASPLDNYWRRADINRMLGIVINKEVVPVV